jgi:biotin carboxylase
MKYILIVGNSFSGLTRYILEQGYEYIVLKDQLRARNPDKQLKRRVLCDFSSRDRVLATVNSLKHPIAAVMTAYEDYVLATSWITEHLGLPGMPPAAAEACTDKFIMRQLFAKAPQKISPDFAIVKSEDDLHTFAASHTFPLILKPANLAKSLLVTKSRDMAELLANYRRAISQIDRVYARYAAHRTPTMLIEEFLEGPIHSVDAFVGKDGEPYVLEEVVDYESAQDIGFDDSFLYSRSLPSSLSAANQQAVRNCAAVGIRALGMRSSPAHAEVIVTPAGPRIVEIGARNGGYRERMHRLANGISITEAALAVAMGEAPDVKAEKNEPISVLELFPKIPGVFRGIAHENELRALPSLNYFAVKATKGTFVGKAADGYKMCAIVILHHADTQQFKRDLDFVNSQVRIETESASE